MHSSFIRLGLGILLAGTCCSLSAQGPQTQDSDPGGNAEAPRVIMRKLPPGSAKLITASDESKNSAIEIFRAATLRRDKLIFVDYDFLLRKCLIRSGQVVDPQWEVGKVTENFSSGDFQIESMALKSSLSADEIAGSKSRGEAWLKERERLRDFIKVQRDGESFLPIETSLDPITPYFSREEFEPRTGGVCLNTENMSLRGRLGSKLIVIESPGLTIPKWIHYFDARALGFSSALEISWGTSLDEVLLRHNTGTPFSVEKHEEKHYVTIAFEQAVRRILLDPERGFLPVYSADFRGSDKGAGKAVVVRGPRLQSWLVPVKVGQHWVPKRVRVLDQGTLVDIEFNWTSVNSGRMDEELGVGSVRIPDGTRIVDRRSIPPTTTIHNADRKE